MEHGPAESDLPRIQRWGRVQHSRESARDWQQVALTTTNKGNLGQVHARLLQY